MFSSMRKWAIVIGLAVASEPQKNTEDPMQYLARQIGVQYAPDKSDWRKQVSKTPPVSPVIVKKKLPEEEPWGIRPSDK